MILDEINAYFSVIILWVFYFSVSNYQNIRTITSQTEKIQKAMVT